MRLDLSHIRQAETDLVRTFQPDAFATGEDEEYRVTAPVAVRLVVHKDRDRFRLVGTVATVLELRCSRCLVPFTMSVDRAFDLRYFPADTGAAPGPVGDDAEVADDDVAITFYRDEQIDLGEMLREQFYLALPMKPLCRTDCRGLCPQCGADWNVEDCACERRWRDPRLAGLEAFMTERKTDDA